MVDQIIAKLPERDDVKFAARMTNIQFGALATRLDRKVVVADIESLAARRRTEKGRLCCALLPLSAQQPAQPQQSVVSFPKDSSTATLISVLITGGGQMYSGEVGRGLTMLGIGTGALIVGTVASTSTSCSDYDCAQGSLAPLAVDALVYVGTWVYSIADAGKSARRYNAAHGISTALLHAEPRVWVGSQGRTHLGLSLRF